MTDTAQHECETNCGRPAPTTRMCWDCVQDILNALDTVTDDHLRTLALISRREEKPFTLRTHSNTLRVHGPGEPMNLTALGLLQDLAAWGQLAPADWANTDRPAHWHHHVPARCQLATDMVDGEAEDKPTADYVNHRLKQAQAYPMPVRRLIPWLADLGIRVTPTQISTWANRGRIQRVNSGPGHPWYSPVDVVRVMHETRP
mgnify:CR=1 FL=1